MKLPEPIPAYIAMLPRCPARKIPTPWFVAWLDDEGNATQRGKGTPDFRVLFPDAIQQAVTHSLCWVCGRPLHRNVAYAFVIGSMCAVNRVSAEPPSHIACADWSARACPFLVRPYMVRREAGLPEHEAPAGTSIPRNPGVSLVWLTRTAFTFAVPGGVLFNVGDPLQVRFYREGREATRDEIMESIASGLPTLQEMAEAEGPEAVSALEQQREAALELLPV